MRPTDIEKLVTVGGVSVHPDGTRAVLAVGHPSLVADANVSQLWELPVTRGEAEGGGADAPPARLLTRGRGDAAPQHSPDGRLLGFLRAPGPGTPAQLFVVDERGGEPVQVTDQPLGVLDFTWFPGSDRVAFVAAVPEHGRYGTVEGLGADAEPPRRITTTRWTQNGRGYTDARAHVFVVDVPDVDAEPWYEPAPSAGPAGQATDGATDDAPSRPQRFATPVRLTSADADHGAPVVTPDGSAVLVLASLHETADLDLRTDVWSFAVPETRPEEPDAKAAPDEKAAPDAPVVPVRVTGDEPLGVGAVGVDGQGRVWFAAQDLGPDGTDFVARQGALYVVEDGAVRRVTDPDEHDVAAFARLVLTADGDAVVRDVARGRVPLLRVRADGIVTEVVGGDVEIGAFDVGGDVLVWSGATQDTVGALGALDLAPVTVDPSAVTGAADAAWSDDVLVPEDLVAAVGAPPLAPATGPEGPREEEHPSADGYPVHGWVAVPQGEGPHPVLLMIHGGPFAQYGVGLFDETQVYVGAGYAVVYCNPRGAAGYGQAHGRAIKEAMGTVDLDDVLAFLDGALAAHPELDGENVGILGGSYGGYLTAWTIAHDHRFRAAVVERGFLDPETFIGTSDIGAFFSEAYTGTDRAHRATQSPQEVVGQVTTPTLVIHSEQDLRCPLSQAERYYLGLRRAGVDAELLVFPGETHELTRSGRPRHRVERFDAILEWFGRYLPVAR